MATKAKGSGAIRAGRAFVELFAEDSRLVRGLRRAQARLRAFGDRVTAMGKRTALAGAALVAPILAAGRSLTNAASNMEETMNKFNVVFGDSADAVKAWGDELGAQVGRSERQIAEFLAGSQDLLVPMGFEPGAAEAMSKEMTKLAIDLASFNNMADADVMRDLQAALTGSGEVMKKYGVIVSESALKQEALNKGLDPKTLNEAQKAMLRFGIIMEGTTAAQGDAVRSAGSFANSKKALAAQIENAAVALGNKLLPIVTPWIRRATAAARTATDWVKANGELVGSIIRATLVVAGIGTALIAAGGAMIAVGVAAKAAAITLGVLAKAWVLVGVAIKAVIALLAIAKAALLLLASPIGIVIAGALAIGAAVLYATGVAGDALDWLKDRFSSIAETAGEAFGAIKDALAAGDFKAAAKVLWTALKLEWTKGVAGLEEIWINFRDQIIGVGRKLLTGLQAAWAITINAITNAWRRLFVALIELWNKFQDFVKPATVELAKLFTIAIGKAQGLSAEEALANSDVEGAVDHVLGRRKARLDEITRNLRTDIDASRGDLEAKLDAISRAEGAFFKQLEKNRKDALGDAEKGVKEARKAFEAAMEAARAGRDPADPDNPAAAPASDFAAKLDELLGEMQKGADAADQTARAMTVRGTFDPAAIGQQFAPSQKIEKEQRDLLERIVEQAEPMRRGVDDIRNSMPSFA